jgi:predicted lipoprotein
MRTPLTLILLAALALPLHAAPPAGLAERVADAHARPAYARLATTTAALQHDADAFCRAPDTAALARLQARHQAAFLAWQGAQHLRFGPIQLFMREFRFDLWPDKRGSVGKHLARLLDEVSTDPGPLEPRRFAVGSVAVQGFSAMERLLHDPATAAFAGPGFAPRCQVLGAIAANLAGMSAALAADWAQPAAPDDPAGDEAGLLANLHTALERVVAQKLALPLGSDAAHARGTRAEAWRSGLARAAIRENLEATRALYRVAFAERARAAGLDAPIEADFEAALSALAAIRVPLAEAVAEPGARAQVETLRTRVSELKARIGGELAPALELTLGFNNLDGD